MADEKEFTLLRSFHIDDGQLEKLSKADVFVLGYELALVDRKLQEEEPIDMPVHSANVARIRSYADSLGRYARFDPCDEPGGPLADWVRLRVA